MTTSAKRLLDDGIPSNVSKLRGDYRLGTSISDIWTPTGLVRADRSMLFENIENQRGVNFGGLARSSFVSGRDVRFCLLRDTSLTIVECTNHSTSSVKEKPFV
jgi:hypothetical protein